MNREKGLVRFDTEVSNHFPVDFDDDKMRVIGIYEKFDELDCFSGKSLSVEYYCPLTGVEEHIWICQDDNPEIIKVFNKEELEIINICQ